MTSQNVNDRKLYGLQYLAGYVIHQQYKSSYKNTKNKFTLSILEASRRSHQCENQNLNSALSRGGLRFISELSQKALTIVEKHFRGKHHRIVGVTISHPFEIVLFAETSVKCEVKPDEDVEEFILKAIVRMYIQAQSQRYWAKVWSVFNYSEEISTKKFDEWKLWKK